MTDTVYLNRQQAAERAKVNVRTIDAWIKAKRLTGYVRAGRPRVCVSQTELDALLVPTPRSQP